ncbi:MAG TPA: alanine racemase [Microbacteriaceae bacterium]|nr:alanine racemase [Microbacteriaceae bacterium]
MTPRPMREARVDLGAIAHNVDTLARVIGTPHTMVVVKAGGYGHGAVAVARTVLEAGADWLGVVDIREALELRAAGVTAPVLAWLHDPAATFDEAIAADIDLGVSYPEQLERVAHAAGAASVQLKVDTGLGRNGASDLEWPEFFAAAAAHERAGRIRVSGLWSHLANAGAAEDLQQVAAFETAIALARSSGLDPQLLHLAATAGALRVPSSRFDLVRLGIGAYGLSPFDDESSADLGLRPALELSAAVASVKRVPEGSGVSYGYDHRTRAASTLALIPLGYGDGIPRHASNLGPVSINGRNYRVAGRVAMDQFVVDAGDDQVAVGDRAILFGDPATGVPSADDWAEAADTINYEIVTRLGGRIERTYR